MNWLTIKRWLDTLTPDQLRATPQVVDRATGNVLEVIDYGSNDHGQFADLFDDQPFLVVQS